MKFDVTNTITGIHDAESIIARILTDRGIPKDKHNSFLHPPSLHTFGADTVGIMQKEMGKILDRIKRAKKKGESVVIYADYDVDGITSAAILWRTLREYGLPAMPYIPHRSQGYGFSDSGLESVSTLHSPSLIIAVDHGINEGAHIRKLKKAGIDVIVLDHHEQNEHESIAGAYAVIHTTAISASGISYLVGEALGIDAVHDDNLVLAGIASLADVIPQRGMARALSYYALRLLSRSTLPGLSALMAQAGLEKNKQTYTSYDVGYLLAPRINAAGRLGDPLVALRLLCTNNPVKATEYAQELELLNRKRQDLLKETLPVAYELAKKQNGKRFRCIASPLFHEGIIGLLAGRLMHEFHVPVFVGVEQRGIIKGSVRSIDAVNIVPLMQQQDSLLLRFGGHEKAGGFSMQQDNLAAFINELDSALSSFDPEIFDAVAHADLALPLPNITTSFAKALESLEPYGEQNAKPLFISRNVSVIDKQPVGKQNGNHMRVVLKDVGEGTIVKGMYFSAPPGFVSSTTGEPRSIAYQVECNRWRGEEAQVTIQSVY